MRLTIELDAASDPVQGTIGVGDGSEKPFSGYVQLIAALEGFRELEGVGELGQDGYRGERDHRGGPATSGRGADAIRASAGRVALSSGPGIS